MSAKSRVLAWLVECAEHDCEAGTYEAMAAQLDIEVYAVKVAVGTLRKEGAVEMVDRDDGHRCFTILTTGEQTAWGNMYRRIGGPNAPATERPCMCCGQPFPSEGIHNRLCQSCKSGTSAELPAQAGNGHVPALPRHA